MRRESTRLVLAVLISIFVVGCSQPAPSTDKKEAQKQASAKPEDSLVNPSLGEVAFTLPQGWIPLKQQSPVKVKDVESLSFIRKIDQSLWANPGPLGTSNLPTMNITISRRAADAKRDDIDPKKLGNSLVKQNVLTNLVEAAEIQIANLPATRIAGDSPQQGRVTIVLLPHNGFLYKWSLYGTKPSDTDTTAALDALLATAKFK
jgi:hypothetical protein